MNRIEWRWSPARARLMAGTCRFTIVVCVLLAAGARPLAAQDPPDVAPELPREIAEWAIAFHNDSAQVRLMGDSRIAASTELVGSVAVIEGSLELGGTIRGSVLVINGDALLLPGARIEGSLTVVGGAIRAPEMGITVGAEQRAFRQPLRYRQDGALLVYEAPQPEEPGIVAGHEFDFGRTDIRVMTRGAYNRVEGLPVSVGGRVALGGANPTWIDGSAIIRTASGLTLDPDRMGWFLRVEQYLGGHLAARLGGTLRTEIAPIEAWGLSDRESSLSTFLLHRDQRDHYEREGWSVYLRVAKPGAAREATLEYRDERHHSVATQAPWTIFDNDEEWRPEPRVADGSLRSLSLRWSYDDRNDRDDPATGWYARAELEQALGGSLVEDVLIENGSTLHETRPADRDFTSLVADLRRYARTGPTSRMAVRLFIGGSLDGGKPLPPQRQHALGGPGSLPAYSEFDFDCGARADTIGVRENAFFPYYGCDRAALLQFEYRGIVGYGWDLGRELGLGMQLGALGWTVFFDAGRAWTEAEAIQDRAGGLDDFVVDAGAGIRLGPIGLYWALPLSRRVENANFFVRLGPRF